MARIAQGSNNPKHAITVINKLTFGNHCSVRCMYRSKEMTFTGANQLKSRLCDYAIISVKDRVTV